MNHATAQIELLKEQCPECAGVLELDAACTIEEPYLPSYYKADDEQAHRTRIAPAVLCTECEFCLEITFD